MRERQEFSSSDLVRLALDNIHPISLCHFWQPEVAHGFIPFYTYWRVKHGLVARATHLYPLYLYPRDWSRLETASTIDWGLSDLAGLEAGEIHMVCDSEEIFAAELSDPDYMFDPSMPYGPSIGKMRAHLSISTARRPILSACPALSGFEPIPRSPAVGDLRSSNPGFGTRQSAKTRTSTLSR